MHFEIYRDTGGEWRWRLVAANGKQIANGGEGYVNRADCENGIRLVKGTNADTPIRTKE
ncbi:YegP family protein [Stella sp.]|uniref:YegP family protein n=1 Tax=Stella sp. TaxID=2912054 RepID=UPI0035AF9218